MQVWVDTIDYIMKEIQSDSMSAISFIFTISSFQIVKAQGGIVKGIGFISGVLGIINFAISNMVGPQGPRNAVTLYCS